MCKFLYNLRILSTWILLAICLLSHGQYLQNWKNYSVTEGLSDNYIECILEDNSGYLWIGTWSGINRFDGQEFIQYRKVDNDTNSIPGNWIYTLFLDSRGTIWVGTDEGIAYYNYNTDKFQTVTGVSRSAIVTIKEDKHGNIWAGGDNMLYQIQAKNKVTLHSKKIPNDNLEIGAIEFINDSILCIGSSNSGIFFFNIHIQSISKQHSVESLQKLKSASIKDIQRVSKNSYMIGTDESEYYVYTFGIDKLLKIKSAASNRINANSNFQNSILLDNGSFLKWNSIDSISHYTSNSNSQFEKENIAIECAWIDRNGNEWIGTHGNGLWQRNKQKEKVQHLASSTTGNKIACFHELKNGEILLGTDGNGVQIFNPINGTIQPVNLGIHYKNAKVLDFHEGEQNEVWISLWSQGIICVDVTTFTVKKELKPNSQLNFPSLEVKEVCLSDSIVWIVTNGSGVFQYSLVSNTFKSPQDGQAIDLQKPKWGNGIVKDSRNRIWVYTSKGLYLFFNHQVQFFSSNQSGGNKIKSNAVVHLMEDSKKQIWIVTESGLEIWNDRTSKFEGFEPVNGKVSGQLKSITEDKKGRIWLGTSNGLVALDTQNKRMYSFNSYTQKGVSFYFKSAITSSTGAILMGTLNGFIFFSPDSIFTPMNVPVLRFTDFQLNNKSVVPFNSKFEKMHIQNSQHIKLDYSDQMITLKFTCIDLTQTQELQYYYMLSGLSSTWVDLRFQKSISFHQLPPGNYELLLKAKNVFGKESSEITKITIEILPPWYRTSWAYFLYVLLSLLVLWGAFYMITQRLRLRNKIMLQEFEHKKELELYESKLNFFTQLSHDIRTPLTLILVPIELLKTKLNDNAEVQKLVSTMERNASSLMALTNELLTFRKLESKEQGFKPEWCDIKMLLEEFCSEFVLLANHNETKFELNLEKVETFLDVGLCKKMMYNLISNAFAHVSKKGLVRISLLKSTNEFKIEVYNSGNAIEEEVKSKLFNPFYSQSNSGHGLGLSIVKEIVKLHKGKIEVENKVDGVAFIITMPLTSNQSK